MITSPVSFNLAQTVNFNCVATIEDVIPVPLWISTICPACLTKMEPSVLSVVCTNGECKKAVRLGFNRSRFEFALRDVTGAATFVVSNAVEKKFSAQSAPTIPLNVYAAYNDEGTPSGDVPLYLLYSIGCTFKFNIKLTPYNFIARYQPTPCSRIQGAIADVEFEYNATKTISLHTTRKENHHLFQLSYPMHFPYISLQCLF
ncbi:unnamed protein product [Cochlearia groenlandica]